MYEDIYIYIYIDTILLPTKWVGPGVVEFEVLSIDKHTPTHTYTYTRTREKKRNKSENLRIITVIRIPAPRFAPRLSFCINYINIL